MDMVCLVEVLIMALRYSVVRIFPLFKLLSLEYFDMASSAEKKDLDGMKTSQKNAELNEESGEMSASKDLPEYLKKKLRARGILKDNQNAGNHLELENVSNCFVEYRFRLGLGHNFLYKALSSYTLQLILLVFINIYHMLLMFVMSFSR